MSSEVLILLATFNGASYLPTQLDSIARQTYTEWRLLVADDGSQDGTRGQLEDFRKENPDRVEILETESSGSAKSNFFRLLRMSPRADYVLCCDQDDEWSYDKLERLVDACRELEQESSSNEPCLVYSDLVVVDEQMKVMAPSFMREIRTRPNKVTFGSTLVENSIPGCSTVVNAALVEKFKSYGGSLESALMHDWWLALLAFGFGTVGYLPDPLVKYRQHSSNSAGSVRRGGARFILQKILGGDSGAINSAVTQAQCFYEAYGDSLPQRPFRQLRAMCELPKKHKLARIVECMRFGILKQGFQRQLYQFLRI